MTCLAGVVAFAYYADKGCDPVSGKLIRDSNQILPYFVMEVLIYPGLPGLYVACLFSASLRYGCFVISRIIKVKQLLSACQDKVKCPEFYLSEHVEHMLFAYYLFFLSSYTSYLTVVVYSNFSWMGLLVNRDRCIFSMPDPISVDNFFYVNQIITPKKTNIGSKCKCS